MTLAHFGTIPIPPGREAGFDHADVYLPQSRLYVAYTGADRIDVIDCAARSYLRSIPGLPGVAGVLIDAEHDLLFSSDRGCARGSIYRCSDEALLGRVQVGQRPNGLAYDASRRHLFVLNVGDPPGVNCTVSVVAGDDLRVIRTIPLPGRPRWALYDAATDQGYANVQKPAQIVVLGGGERGIVKAFDVRAAGPHGLSIRDDRLFCAADGEALVVLHRDTGEVLGSVELPGEPDVIMHAPELNRVYVAVGSPGTVSVIDDRSLDVLGTVQTGPGAHTIGWDPDR